MDSIKLKKWVKKFSISERKEFATSIMKTCKSCKFCDSFSMCFNCPFTEIFDTILEVNQDERKHFTSNN